MVKKILRTWLLSLSTARLLWRFASLEFVDADMLASPGRSLLGARMVENGVQF